MKWPNTVTVLRHGESGYNKLKLEKEKDPLYRDFKEAYDAVPRDTKLVRAMAETLLLRPDFVLHNGDHDTPLVENGWNQARITGQKLSSRIALPNVVLLSPYTRTKDTFAGLCEGWPELADVNAVEDERVREQEHGLALLYNDWRIFNVMHPEQEQLHALEGSYWYRFPQGENVPDVRERWRSIQNTLTREYAGKDVMIITHHISLLAFKANMERLGVEEYMDLDNFHKPVNCGVSIYRGMPELGHDGRLVQEIYNEQLY